MAHRFEHKGFQVEIDPDREGGPRMRIADSEIPVRRIGNQFITPLLPYVKAEDLTDLARAVVEQSRDFETHE